ncbi:MAG: histidine kinase, partial [Gemmatimonadales bacterium]
MRRAAPTLANNYFNATPARHWAIIFGAWTVFGLAQLLAQVLVFQSADMYSPPLWRIALQYLPRLWLWAAMTPFIEGWDHRLRDRFKFLPLRISAHIPLYIAAAMAEAVVRRTTIVVIGLPLTVPFHVTLLYFADIEAVRYIAALMLGRALAAAAELTEREGREAALKEEIGRAQLLYLDLQLQPHFLFNALGSISELAHEAPAAAARMVEHLSSLLRYATERSIGQEVTLRHELDALSPYLEIQRMRFPDWLSISERIEPDASEALVPRLLLQPLVENAIRHGLSHRRSGGLIEFRARSEDDQLVLSVHDNGEGLTAGSSIPGLGIGLTNIRERLTTLYGDSQSLDLVSHAAGGVEVVVKIPLRHAAPAQHRDVSGADTVDTLAASEVFAGVSPPQTPVRTEALQLIGVWLGAGVILTLMSFLYVLIRHPLDHEPLLEVVRRHVIHSSLWILLTPVVLTLGKTFSLTRDKLAINVPLHVVFGCLVGFAHIAAARVLVGGPQPPLVDMIFMESLFWNMAAYAILLGFSERKQIEIWIRERDVAAAKMRSELTLARLSAVTLELRPEFLLSALTTLRTLVLVDASLAESLLSRFAQFLRLTLDSLGQQNSTLEREVNVLRAYGDLHRAAAGHFPEIEMNWSPGLEKYLVPSGLLRTLVDRLLEMTGLPERVVISAVKSDRVLTLTFVPVDIDPRSPAVYSIRRDPSERLGRLTD